MSDKSQTPDFEWYKEFGAYRGVIERVEIPSFTTLASDAQNRPVRVVGRHTASKIVRELKANGYIIVRSPAALGE